MSIRIENYNVILDKHLGWYTAYDSDKIPDGFSPDLMNVRITGSHVRGALGYQLIGTRNSDVGEITSQYTYNRNDGQQRMVRVRDNATTGILEWWDATNEEWYTLLAGLTTGKIMGFTEYNTSTTNNMLFCNGIENMSKWTGAITRLTAAASGSSDTLQVESTADFPATGTIIYNGTEKAYDSKTGTSFHATTGNWHASASTNDGVAEAADDSTHSAIAKGNILLSAKDRLWIAGQPSGPNNLDYSDEGSFSTFTGGSNRSDSGTEDFFNIGGAITGLAEKGDEIIVIGEDGADGFSFTYPTSTTKAPNFRQIFRSKGSGCKNFKSVVNVNNDIYFVNKNGLVSITDLEGTEKVWTKSITRDILPTIKEYDFSDAACIFHEKEQILLMSCKTDNAFSGNDVVIGIEFFKTAGGDETYGITRFDWPVNDFSILENELYFGSSIEMNSHKGFTTYQNDGAPRTIRYAYKRHNLGNPLQRKGTPFVAVKGFIKDGTDIDVDTLFDAGFKGTLTKTIESSGAYVSSAVLNTIGAFALGTNPIGATLTEVSELKQFLVYIDLTVDYDYSDIQLIFSSETDGGTFIITHVGFPTEAEGFAKIDEYTI